MLQVMIRKLLLSAVRITLMLAFMSGCLAMYTAQPTLRSNVPPGRTADPRRLEGHVRMLSEEFHPRNYRELENLRRTADYIADVMEGKGAVVSRQHFEVEGQPYQNVSGVFGGGKGRKLVVGAHYDTYDLSPGADDNASGVAGLLELARLLGEQPPEREIELVAYALEEPPFFATRHMGSHHHATSLMEHGEEIDGMIALEMIGYFSDEPGSQTFPLAALGWIYPRRGNFIGVVGRWGQARFTRNVKAGMKGTTDLPVYSITAPRFLQGIDFSDHRSYWQYGMNSVMITDTAFFRNPWYHSLGDTADTLDYERMAHVVTAVFAALHTL